MSRSESRGAVTEGDAAEAGSTEAEATDEAAVLGAIIFLSGPVLRCRLYSPQRIVGVA